MEQTIKECCPIFHPEKWNQKTFNWEHKKFIKASVPTFFHIPFRPMLGKKIRNMMKIAKDSRKLPDDMEDVLLLFTDPTAFKSELFLSVIDTVPNAENTTLSGTYLTKVFDGAYNAIPKFMKQMDAYLAKQDKKANQYYVHYAYCPKCAKENGHNYMVLFANVSV
ncbi:MAG: hypothetical protein HKN53_07585 [Maribacter sp.]|nr:hypothetical protein [Maribacter sp.]